MTPIHKYSEELTKMSATSRFVLRCMAVGREILTATWELQIYPEVRKIEV